MTQTSINYGIVLYELSVPQEAAETSRRILEEVKELSKVLESPVVPFDEKEKVIGRIFPEEMKNFLCVVCKYAHAALLPEIFRAYQDYYNEQHKILTADLHCVCASNGGAAGRDQEIPSEEISDAGRQDPNHKG